MNNDKEAITSILSELWTEYKSLCQSEIFDQKAPITERDIVAEIYSKLKDFCAERKNLSVHCEIKPYELKPAYDKNDCEKLKGFPRIDIVILSGQAWIAPAINIQNVYNKGKFEARYSAIPVEFFHTAIEVKIQSKPGDAEKDIIKLRKLQEQNNACNCFFVLLNARGQRADHKSIIEKHAKEKGICIFEYSCNNA